jgi:GNAT superfamily N-acetyltransferase
VPRLREAISGPRPAGVEDIPAMNAVFSESFTDRYRRDGLVGVRVPQLNPKVWRYAIADAAEGAMVWHDDDGLAAFNMVHRSGGEGWMGPLAVRPDLQGQGLGKRIVQSGVDWLRAGGVQTIGLETMPRTVDNIGFYSGLEFVPRYLTVTLTRELSSGGGPSDTLSTASDPESVIEACRALTSEVQPSCDFIREIQLTADLRLGDTSVVHRDGALAGFALWHSSPLAEGRPAEELRVLKLVALDLAAFEAVIEGLMGAGEDLGVGRLSVRCQTGFPEAYRALVQCGFQVQWTDLRMTYAGYDEPIPDSGIVFSNWEI